MASWPERRWFSQVVHIVGGGRLAGDAVPFRWSSRGVQVLFGVVSGHRPGTSPADEAVEWFFDDVRRETTINVVSTSPRRCIADANKRPRELLSVAREDARRRSQ